MKKNRITAVTACALFACSSLLAQGTIYDATRLLGSDLNGTARYVGRGGAMGALGADITTMGTNPAGTGLYRSSDATVSFGLGNNDVKGQYVNATNQVDHTYGTFDNAGFVYAYKVGNHTPLRFVNFGVNYRRNKNFNRNLLMSGTYVASQTEQMADMPPEATVSTTALVAKNAYANPNLPWLGIMGDNSNLIDPTADNVYTPFYEEVDDVNGD